MSIAAAVHATETEPEREVETGHAATSTSALDAIELPTLADPRPVRTPGYMYEGYFYTS